MRAPPTPPPLRAPRRGMTQCRNSRYGKRPNPERSAPTVPRPHPPAETSPPARPGPPTPPASGRPGASHVAQRGTVLLPPAGHALRFQGAACCRLGMPDGGQVLGTFKTPRRPTGPWPAGGPAALPAGQALRLGKLAYAEAPRTSPSQGRSDSAGFPEGERHGVPGACVQESVLSEGLRVAGREIANGSRRKALQGAPSSRTAQRVPGRALSPLG